MLLVAVSVTDVRLSGRLFWCVWNFYGCFHVHVFCFHLPDETSSERAPAFGVKRRLRAWPAPRTAAGGERDWMVHLSDCGAAVLR